MSLYSHFCQPQSAQWMQRIREQGLCEFFAIYLALFAVKFLRLNKLAVPAII
jgi:hypothetical protein